MLVNKIMQVLSNLFGLNKKINANDIAIKNNKGNAETLDNFLKGTVLYDNPEGSNGNITLVESTASYMYIDIYFRTSDGVNAVGFTRVYVPDGKNINLSKINISGDSLRGWMKSKDIIIRENKINNADNSYMEFTIGTQQNGARVNLIYITRVVGYK